MEQMQVERRQLNEQICKSAKFYSGTENLIHATENKELKERAVLELTSVCSQWDLLREQLRDLNSNIDAFQNSEGQLTLTMLAVAFKESVAVERAPTCLSRVIMEHYSEDPEKYHNEINDFLTLREHMQHPSCDAEGIKQVMEYYNQLFFLDLRFFEPEKSNGIHFSWYDLLSGDLVDQFTVDFERACVLFNLGALYSQIGTKQDRSTVKGVSEAMVNYQRAAGVFRFISDNFINPPCPDLSENAQNALGSLMMAQVHECAFEKAALEDSPPADKDALLLTRLRLVVKCYKDVQKYLVDNQDVPTAWLAIVMAKTKHFAALSYYYAAKVCIALDTFPEIFNSQQIGSKEFAMKFARFYLDCALENHEQALRYVKNNKHLRQISTITEIFEHTQTRSVSLSEQVAKAEEILDFIEVHPLSFSKAESIFEPLPPLFHWVKTCDIFARLGPLRVFNSRNNWTLARRVNLVRQENSFGFTVKGNTPVTIASVDPGSPAERAGLHQEDIVVRVNQDDVKWANHQEVVALIKAAGDSFCLYVVSLVKGSKSLSL